MPDTTTNMQKENDYTLNVTTEYWSGYSSSSRSLTRLFNFKSQQVTTLSREWISVSNGATSSQQMNIQNFGDVQSQEEIKFMREKLIELGGHPSELDATPGKQTLRQPATP